MDKKRLYTLYRLCRTLQTNNRITGSKEATTLLNRCGVGITYTNMRDINNNWAKSVTTLHKKMLPPGFIPGRSVHISFDNLDGKQQNRTGSHKTHYTIVTIFQAKHLGDTKSNPKASKKRYIFDQEKPDYGSFTIKKEKVSPIVFRVHG